MLHLREIFIMNTIENLQNTINSIQLQIDNVKQAIESKQQEVNSFEYECSESEYDEYLDEVYGDVEVSSFTYSTSEALKKLDPIAYRCGKSDYESEYDLSNCEEYTNLQDELEDLESELEQLEYDLEEAQDELDSLESEN